MNKFVDLFILPSNDHIATKEIIKTLKDFDYILIGIDKNYYTDEIKEICDKENIKVIQRTNNLNEKRYDKIFKYTKLTYKKEIIELTRKYRYNSLVIDINKIKEVDEQLLNFISQRGVGIEILYSQLLDTDIVKNRLNIMRLKDILEYCLRKNITVFISSGASHSRQIRSAIDVASFLKCLNLKKYEIKSLLEIKRVLEVLNYEI
jgi:RNase P subunit p30.